MNFQKPGRSSKKPRRNLENLEKICKKIVAPLNFKLYQKYTLNKISKVNQN